MTVKGQIKDGRPQPTSFMSAVVREDEKVNVQFWLDGSRVRDLKVEEPPPEDDRVPIADAHKTGVIDPLSALLIPGPADPMAREGCERTLAMFDGMQRAQDRLCASLTRQERDGFMKTLIRLIKVNNEYGRGVLKMDQPPQR